MSIGLLSSIAGLVAPEVIKLISGRGFMGEGFVGEGFMGQGKRRGRSMSKKRVSFGGAEPFQGSDKKSYIIGDPVKLKKTRKGGISQELKDKYKLHKKAAKKILDQEGYTQLNKIATDRAFNFLNHKQGMKTKKIPVRKNYVRFEDVGLQDELRKIDDDLRSEYPEYGEYYPEGNTIPLGGISKSRKSRSKSKMGGSRSKSMIGIRKKKVFGNGLVKGSKAAKERMAYIRSLRK